MTKSNFRKSLIFPLTSDSLLCLALANFTDLVSTSAPRGENSSGPRSKSRTIGGLCLHDTQGFMICLAVAHFSFIAWLLSFSFAPPIIQHLISSFCISIHISYRLEGNMLTEQNIKWAHAWEATRVSFSSETMPHNQHFPSMSRSLSGRCDQSSLAQNLCREVCL